METPGTVCRLDNRSFPGNSGNQPVFQPGYRICLHPVRVVYGYEGTRENFMSTEYPEKYGEITVPADG